MAPDRQKRSPASKSAQKQSQPKRRRESSTSGQTGESAAKRARGRPRGTKQDLPEPKGLQYEILEIDPEDFPIMDETFLVGDDAKIALTSENGKGRGYLFWGIHKDRGLIFVKPKMTTRAARQGYQQGSSPTITCQPALGESLKHLPSLQLGKEDGDTWRLAGWVKKALEVASSKAGRDRDTEKVAILAFFALENCYPNHSKWLAEIGSKYKFHDWQKLNFAGATFYKAKGFTELKAFDRPPSSGIPQTQNFPSVADWHSRLRQFSISTRKGGPEGKEIADFVGMYTRKKVTQFELEEWRDVFGPSDVEQLDDPVWTQGWWSDDMLEPDGEKLGEFIKSSSSKDLVEELTKRSISKAPSPITPDSGDMREKTPAAEEAARKAVMEIAAADKASTSITPKKEVLGEEFSKTLRAKGWVPEYWWSPPSERSRQTSLSSKYLEEFTKADAETNDSSLEAALISETNATRERLLKLDRKIMTSVRDLS